MSLLFFLFCSLSYEHFILDSFLAEKTLFSRHSQFFFSSSLRHEIYRPKIRFESLKISFWKNNSNTGTHDWNAVWGKKTNHFERSKNRCQKKCETDSVFCKFRFTFYVDFRIHEFSRTFRQFFIHEFDRLVRNRHIEISIRHRSDYHFFIDSEWNFRTFKRTFTHSSFDYHEFTQTDFIEFFSTTFIHFIIIICVVSISFLFCSNQRSSIHDTSTMNISKIDPSTRNRR